MDEFDQLFLYVQSFLKTKEVLKSVLSSLKKDADPSYFLEEIRKINKDCLERSKQCGKFFKKYQLTAIQHILVHRGLICAFDVGTGKTLTAVASCYSLDRLTKLFHIKATFVIVTPTSLQHNFKNEMKTFGMDPCQGNFIFYTTAKFSIEYRKGNIDYPNLILVIDEAHVFRTDYRFLFSEFPVEDIKENTRAEHAVECASIASKVLLLTATPIYNRTHDIVNLVSMVRGVYPPFEQKPEELSDEEFKKIYGRTILFQKADVSSFDEKGNRVYPERKDIIVKVIMHPGYLKKYTGLEEEIKNKKKKNDDEEERSNAFNILMRQASNDIDECIKLKPVLDIVLKNKKTILYSEFLSKGILLIREELEKRKIPFFVINGETTMTKRKQIVEKFNVDNGECNLILITKAGGEGLDFKGVRKVIIFEKGWNVSVEEQVIGRAIRYKSHIHLPPSKQNVKVYNMMTLKPYYIDFESSLQKILKREEPFSHRIMVYGEEYIDPSKRIMPVSDKIENIGVDLNMYVQALLKEKENLHLRNRLEKEQITLHTIHQKDEFDRSEAKTIFDRNETKKIPAGRIFLLPLPEKGFVRRNKKIEIFENYHASSKKYATAIDVLFAGMMDGVEGEYTTIFPDMIDYLPRETQSDKYLLDIILQNREDKRKGLVYKRNEIIRMEHILSKFLSPSYTKYKIYFLIMEHIQTFLICDRSQPKNSFCTPFFTLPEYFVENLLGDSYRRNLEEILFPFIAEVETFARKKIKSETVLFAVYNKEEIYPLENILESVGYSKKEEYDCAFFEKGSHRYFSL